MIIYTVKKGDSVYKISKRYGVPMQRIIADNQLENPNVLVVGQALVLRTESLFHRITAPQDLEDIARMYGASVDTLLMVNPNIVNPADNLMGQTVIIPQNNRKMRTIDVNGYAFPNIAPNTLTRTLPYLTFVSIFSYQVRPDGTFLPIPDEPVISAANSADVKPMMVITNIMEGGSFDSKIASTILNDENVQNTLLQNILQTLRDKNYRGLDIDFEYIYPSDRESYNRFVEKTVNFLRPLGYIISTALAPKVSADQPGLLYEAHDYEAHGRLVDHVILMTYEWGYTFGPAQAVAPIDQVERVLQYAVSAIPSEKILMGMPNYGYDWTLPFVTGSAARSISNLEAVRLAAKVGAEIKYDAKVQAPYFNYYDSNKQLHIVWFDDARSIQARLRLVEKYNLGGVSYWTINTFFNQNWLVLQSMYHIRKG